MKLKSLGKVFILDSENNFVYKKNKKLSGVLIDFINITLDCFASNYNIHVHSIYLRGSCLDRDNVDRDTFDIDLNIIHEDESIKPNMWLHHDYHPQIMQKMEELHGFSVFPDVDIRHKNFFLHKTDTRFYSMKIWGEEDLSLSTISHKKITKYFADQYDTEFNHCMSKIKNAKNDCNSIMVRMSIKVFYRNFGLKTLLENGKWSRSVYQCHNALMEKYPKYFKELTNILDLFLNVESYSRQQIIDVLDEMQAVIKCLYYGKPSPYIVEVCYK